MLETDILTFTEYACSLGIILEICVAYVIPLVTIQGLLSIEKH
jgi:hypothetical protein